MKSYILLVCFTLFAAATAFTVYDKFFENARNDSGLELADNKDCKCVNGRCVYNKGKMKCVCYPKHSPTDEETCQPCDCGNLGQCIFVLRRTQTSYVQYEKKCVCDRGSAEKDGKCVDCNCGENSKCEFEGEDRTCYCLDGYAEKDGVCQECNCGKFGDCTFENGVKTCECFDGFLLNNGICEECDCGEYGKCSFQEGRKVCDCDEGYKENDGYCDECQCDNSYGCDYVSGQKRCWCNAGYIQRDRTCVVNKCTQKCGENPDVVCIGDPRGDEEVSCGCKDKDKLFDSQLKLCRDNMCIVKCGRNPGVKCSGDPLYHVDCGCDREDSAFVDKNSGCKECNCGPNSVGCQFKGLDYKYCTCKEGFVDKSGVCEVGCGIYRSCENGGKCNHGFCECLPGTSGEFCEVIEGCNALCPEDADCFYDTSMQRADCQCRDSSRGFNRETRTCKKTCGVEDRDKCDNGGECKGKFCDCPPGTSGDLCEKVDECERNPGKCKDGSECVYNVNEKRAYCRCPNEREQYDLQTETCKRTCDGRPDDCNNGGQCNGIFCICPPGTSGDLCEVVDECKTNPEKCKDGSECLYNIYEQRAYCRCPYEGTQYDPVSQRCRKTCDGGQGNCNNEGECDGTFCKCPPGTSGDLCETVDECISNPEKCKDGSECLYNIYEQRAYCRCPEEGTDYDPVSERCKRTCDDRQQENCNNGGSCDGTFCKCPPGTSGDLCEVVDECKENPTKCKDGSECVYNIYEQRPYCKCPHEGTQYDPVSERCKRTCDDTNSCQNGGKCGINRFCDCLPGTSGEFCETIDECPTCEDGAYCVFDAAERKAMCMCREMEKSYDYSNNKCKVNCRVRGGCENGGECREEFCSCLDGTSGDLCENVDACMNGLCGTGDDVRCLFDVNRQTAVCQCCDDSKIFDETTKTCKACDCGRNAIDCTFTNGQKICYCPDGFTEKNGICEKTRCIDKSCTNGKCEIVSGEEVCKCYEGYALEGDYCRRLNCTNTPCINGTCVVRHGNIEQCVCPAGHSLVKDTCVRGSCRFDTCFGGHCATIQGELMCVCPKGYELKGIGCFATVCEIQHCFGGYCVVNDAHEEVCTCHDGYYLENDVCKKILCKKTSCFGGHCNFQNGEEVCTCPAEHVLYDGVCRVDLSHH